MKSVEKTAMIGAYVPCCNNAGSILKAVGSVQNQSVAVDRLIVVDDGSTDGSLECLKEAGVEVIALERNHGRGYVRSLAMERLDYDWVLCCDATNVLDQDFLKNALKCFEEPGIASVHGVVISGADESVAGRWRNRHLFNSSHRGTGIRDASLSTWGTLMKRACVLDVGNFKKKLKHSEDRELSKRLELAGFRILESGECKISSVVTNSISKVLERYWRWNVGENEEFALREYLRRFWYSIRVLSRRDMRDRDFLGIGISVLTSQYYLVKALKKRLRGEHNEA